MRYPEIKIRADPATSSQLNFSFRKALESTNVSGKPRRETMLPPDALQYV